MRFLLFLFPIILFACNNECNCNEINLDEDISKHLQFLEKYNTNNLSVLESYLIGKDIKHTYLKTELSVYENLEKKREILYEIDSTLYREDKSYLDFTLHNSYYTMLTKIRYAYLDYENNRLYRILDNDSKNNIDTLELKSINPRNTYNLFNKYSHYRSHLKDPIANSTHGVYGVFTNNIAIDEQTYKYSFLFNSSSKETEFYYILNSDIEKLKK